MTLSDDARHVIDSARAAYAPGGDDRARVRRALAVHIAIAAGAATGAATGSSFAAVMASKAAVIGLVASAAVGTTVAVRTFHARDDTRAQGAVAARGAGPRHLATAAPKPPVAPEAATPAELAPPPSSQPAIPLPARAPRPSVETEARLLGEAQRALASGDARRALALLDEHAGTFPRGTLAEERRAARIVALCALGRTTQAKSEARAFLARTPHSPLAIRVRAACSDGADHP